MSNLLAITLALCLFADANVPVLYRFRDRPVPISDFPQDPGVSPLPAAGEQAGGNPARPRAATLQQESRLEIVRYVAGEFAHALKPLPAGKEGFLLYVSKPLNQPILDRAVATHGAAVRTGDNIQITRIEFREHQIVIDVNGGGRIKRRWRDRLQIGIGGGGLPQSSTTKTDDMGASTTNQPGTGSTLFLEFNRPLPDLSPADLKQILSPFFDFSKQRSAAVFWIDTLPPAMKKAIQERRPVIGMDREELVAAIGRPDRKVRERDSDGNEIEDWIYGQPPSKTVFVRFQGDRVTNIKQFPQ